MSEETETLELVKREVAARALDVAAQGIEHWPGYDPVAQGFVLGFEEAAFAASLEAARAIAPDHFTPTTYSDVYRRLVRRWLRILVSELDNNQTRLEPGEAVGAASNGDSN